VCILRNPRKRMYSTRGPMVEQGGCIAAQIAPMIRLNIPRVASDKSFATNPATVTVITRIANISALLMEPYMIYFPLWVGALCIDGRCLSVCLSRPPDGQQKQWKTALVRYIC